MLYSVAEQKSARSVEQLLGRILRLPNARRKKREDLNRAYASATTTSFQNTAATLRDGLVKNGFERVEAQALVRAVAEPLSGFKEGGAAYVFEEVLPEGIDADTFKLNVETATGGRVEIDMSKRVIRARGALTEYDRQTMILAIPEAAIAAVEALVRTIAAHRDKRQAGAFQTALFAQNGLDFKTSSDVALVFHEGGYGYNQPYKGRTEFKTQLVGDLSADRSNGTCVFVMVDDQKFAKLDRAF